VAIRFDTNSPEKLTLATTLAANVARTMCGWFYISADTNDYAAFMQMANDGSIWVGLTSDGVSIELWNGWTSDYGSTLDVGTWYHIALTWASGGNTYAYVNGVQDASLSAGNIGANETMSVGNDAWAQQFNGRVAALKIWTAQLSQAEIAQEMNTIRPQRTANLHGWWPCLPGATERDNDYSGNGRDWTQNGTLSDEDGPPAPWGSLPMIVPAISIGGGVPAVGNPWYAYAQQ